MESSPELQVLVCPECWGQMPPANAADRHGYLLSTARCTLVPVNQRYLRYSQLLYNVLKHSYTTFPSEVLVWPCAQYEMGTSCNKDMHDKGCGLFQKHRLWTSHLQYLCGNASAACKSTEVPVCE